MPPVRAILDFPDSPRSVYTDPVDVIETGGLDEVRAALRAVEDRCRAGATAVGYVGYEAAAAFDAALVTRPAAEAGAPLVWFALFAGPPAEEVPSAAARAVPALSWEPDASAAEFGGAVADIRAGIAAGDVYQVNHTLRFRAQCEEDPVVLYDALASTGQGRYHALLETPEWAVVSASPELFLDIRDGVVVTRPMKGTMRRGRWLEEDRAAAERLAASAKERAENLMIVDLLRNDLGRIARFGTVSVPHIYDIETYPTVHQMTSTVRGELRDGVRLDDIFAAMFPCGSVTGAPKVTAMRRIARLERSARGAYCGAIGIVRADGSATFNVAIRTLLLDRLTQRATYGAGAGITWDSLAAAEYDEVIAKTDLLRYALPPFALLETLRLDDGVYARLPLHIERLRASAEYWDFPPHTAAAALQALECARDAAGTGRWRVRLTVARTGDIDITRTPLHDEPYDGARNVALARSPVSAYDRLLFHKTTARAVYDARRRDWPDAFDVLLHNEDGCVTEFTTGNIVIELDGERLTPARTCGLLAGTFREQLLRSGAVREAMLTIDDVRRATRMWYINSVREWVEVTLR